MAGDHIVAIDTVATPGFTDLTAALKTYAGKPVKVTLERNGKAMTVTAKPTDSGKLGFQLKSITDIYPTVTEHYSFLHRCPKDGKSEPLPLATT